jgi:hypothetical protein
MDRLGANEEAKRAYNCKRDAQVKPASVPIRRVLDNHPVRDGKAPGEGEKQKNSLIERLFSASYVKICGYTFHGSQYSARISCLQPETPPPAKPNLY